MCSCGARLLFLIDFFFCCAHNTSFSTQLRFQAFPLHRYVMLSVNVVACSFGTAEQVFRWHAVFQKAVERLRTVSARALLRLIGANKDHGLKIPYKCGAASHRAILTAHRSTLALQEETCKHRIGERNTRGHKTGKANSLEYTIV